MSFIRSSALLGVLVIASHMGVAREAAPQPVVDIRGSVRPTPVRHAADGAVKISGSVSSPDAEVNVRVTLSTGGSAEAVVPVAGGKFTCSYPADFTGAPPLAASLLYVDASTGPDLSGQRAECVFIIRGADGPPDLPSAFSDDFIDSKGKKDADASTWAGHRELVNLFMRSRGAKLSGIGRADFDLAKKADFARFKELGTLYDFDHRDRDWSTPLNHRVARAFWQAEWNRWFGPGNDHPWDGDADNRKPENYRPYTFTNDLADLYILHRMRQSLHGAAGDNRATMSSESLANLIALQQRGTENFAKEDGLHYTAGAFRYGMFETGEWLEEGTGWFVSPKSGDHRHGGVFNGRSAWALGEAVRHDPSGPDAAVAAEALALTLRFCLHDGLAKNYTKRVGDGLPFWRQAGEHGYLTLGMVAAASVKPDLPVVLQIGAPPVPLKDVTARALDALVAALNKDGHWTKYPDQDAMGLAALAEGALAFPDHPHAAAWKGAVVRVADGWLAAKHDPSERKSPCHHFGRREGSRMTYYIGDKEEVHINLYISGLWIHALAKTWHLTGGAQYRARLEGMLSYLCGDNPFHVRLLNEMGGVPNIIRDTDDSNSRMSWDCYPESTAFVQIGLLHWLDAIHPKP
ncbi:hypothetical protein OVA24_15080 [Luteolibacter sp. SL250]|uniref:hypothetical protein n=1 Tax=Luteolibacter sp. SL250 TaxID=2995170 RepID=UPI00226E6B06|nr:hypothetical protein [Luteolibacter sp. SL250]WAC18556.1 hypothetical protein OVA24_15080 [Luteolibacter sp. SL250]